MTDSPIDSTIPVDSKPITNLDKPPVVAKTTETKETTTISGPPVQDPPPATVADDWPREILAAIVILQFAILVGYIVYTGKVQENNSIVIAEVGFVGIVLNYYFGSSSGSTRKSAQIDKVNNG